jgi:hypothetical protein
MDVVGEDGIRLPLLRRFDVFDEHEQKNVEIFPL